MKIDENGRHCGRFSFCPALTLAIEAHAVGNRLLHPRIIPIWRGASPAFTDTGFRIYDGLKAACRQPRKAQARGALQENRESVKINNPKEVLPKVAAPVRQPHLFPGVTHGS